MSLKINNFDVPVASVTKPGTDLAPYVGFGHAVKELRKGYRQSSNHAAFKADTIFEKDIGVPMRDGVKLYCDVFRPAEASKSPAIIMWSPYGKGGNGPHGLHMLPGRFGVAQERLSGFEKFEGLDPAEWTARGYAIVNFDLRGSWDSEGVLPWLGKQDGEDGYDAIEFIAKQPWCTGKVAMAGNSWLAMSQFFIAAARPPHLVAIAPWEGATDFYRDTLCRGGVPYPYKQFWKILELTQYGSTGVESITQMLEKHPLFNEYWQDKVVELSNINVPSYVLASYSTNLHTSGSIRAYKDIGTEKKWLRIHAKQEWSDLYSEFSTNDLHKFLDRYCRDVDNGWESTSRVRVSLLGFNNGFIENIPFDDYPIPEGKVEKFYLHPAGKLSISPPSTSYQESYDSSITPKFSDNDPEELVFKYHFTKPAWLAGFSHVTLYVSCEESEEIDVFVQLRKADIEGNLPQNMNVPAQDLVPPVESNADIPNSCFYKYLGAPGSLRASHSEGRLPSGATSLSGVWPQYRHDRATPVQRGSVVKLDIPIWPAGITFEQGESLVIKVSGHPMGMMDFPNMQIPVENKGRHVIHMGGEHSSHLVVPLLDPR
ncbi:hypothetical protein N7469_002106 [Neofusicoccum parvum]|uniref:Uncharacterized protein n=1 Tax=Neofusicoccum parvum TaxID=310453 RepID=A0ACB5SLC8_9PEZI|nr:hypothetical protein N7469_002106 [Neofusicoccum parvum]